MLVAVAGCVAQAEGEEIPAPRPVVDIVVGPQAYHRLPELVARANLAGNGGVLDTSFPAEPKFDSLPEIGAAPGVTAFLTIQEGCDKFCTFCVVPYTRGVEYSRPGAEIIAEAKPPRCRRGQRDHAARPERQRLSRRGAPKWTGGWRRMAARRTHSRPGGVCLGSPASATRHRIRAMSMTGSSPRIARSRS